MSNDSTNRVASRSFRQLMMLTFIFLLGMAANLIGLPSELHGAIQTLSNVLIILHALVGIGLIVGAIMILVQAKGPGRKLALVGLVVIVVTFAFGLLTMATNSGWWSYFMAVGFLASAWIYGILWNSMKTASGPADAPGASPST